MRGATGVVRKIDNVGRITVPTEMMKSLGINNGDSIELLLFTEECLLLRKYEPFINVTKCIKLIEDKTSDNNFYVLDEIDEIISLLNNVKNLYKTYLGMD